MEAQTRWIHPATQTGVRPCPKLSKLEKETRTAQRSTPDGHETVGLKRERKLGNPAFSIRIRRIASYAAEGEYTTSGADPDFRTATYISPDSPSRRSPFGSTYTRGGIGDPAKLPVMHATRCYRNVKACHPKVGFIVAR